MEDEPTFSQFRHVIFELQEKRKEVVTLKSELNIILGERAVFRTEAQQLKEDVDSLKSQLKVSLSTINLQEETKAAITAAPNKVHFHLLEKQLERLTARCDELKITLTKLSDERDSLKGENDKLRNENHRLQTEGEETKVLIERVKSEFLKLDAEQKFVKNMIVSAEAEYLKENEKLRRQVATFERENQSLLEEKLKFFSGCNSKVTNPDEEDQKASRALLETVEKLKYELRMEQNEKAEIQKALKRSVEFQEKMMEQFDSELSEM